jgi:putative addiction module component (TIGR02574 family)
VTAKRRPSPDDILPEYDFSRARPNKYAALTNSQREELDRRLDEVDRDGPSGIPWEEVLRRLRSKAE